MSSLLSHQGERIFQEGGGANGPDGVDGFPQTLVLLEEASGTIHILLGLHMDHSGS